MPSRLLVRGLVLALLTAGFVCAQSIPFNLLLTENGSSSTIPNDTNLGFSTTVGTQTSATVQATYIGNLPATVTQSPPQWLVGSTEFSVASTVVAPLVLNPGDSFKFTITFSPANASHVAGQLNIPFTVPGAGGTPTPSAIVLALDGTAPQFTLSYVLQTDDNVIPIDPGGTIPFSPTQINTTASANLDINNVGSGPGVITGISLVSGSPVFKLQLIPLLPAQVSAASALQLLVTYSPTAVESDTGQILITYQGGATATVNLTGSGATSSFTYKYLVQGSSTPVKPGGTIVLPGANVGDSSSLIVQVTNTGNANGTINSVSNSNPEFVLSNVPITLPLLKPGDSLSFTITFTPTQVGPQTGQLVVGSDFFNLSGQGLGPKLTFAYTSSAGTTTVDPTMGGAVVFPPIEVGQSEHLNFTVTNSGSLAATISNIGPSVANGPYTLSGLPPLPLRLQPKQSATFTIIFTPTSDGFSDGSLILDTTSISLVGSGTTPPALPAYTITGPSGTVQPATSSNISLTLSKGYALDLNGTLTLSTDGSFGTDQSVQFDTGGRVVDFTIPANSTSADFAGQGSQLLLQTGTVAESVTLTPTFTTSGGVDVTPSSPTTLHFTVASVAPVLVTAQVTSETATSFDLVLTGYSTTRSLTSLNVTFNPAPGFNIGTSELTVDLSQPAAAWFASTGSESFGGQFQIIMPFVLQGTATTGHTLLESIASVTATVSNGTGTSGTLQAGVQ